MLCGLVLSWCVLNTPDLISSEDTRAHFGHVVTCISPDAARKTKICVSTIFFAYDVLGQNPSDATSALLSN